MRKFRKFMSVAAGVVLSLVIGCVCLLAMNTVYAKVTESQSISVTDNTAYMKSLVLGYDNYSSPQTHALGYCAKVIKITSDPTGSEQDSGWDVPGGAIILDVLVNVTTAEATGATKTMDVGTDGSASNDADGFLNDIDVSSTGLKRSSVTLTGGAYYTSTTRGALLRNFVQGSGTDDRGLYSEIYDTTSGGDSVTYTAGSADWAEFRGEIIVVYWVSGI